MMKKKLVALALSILMVLSVFAGCGSGATEPISADPIIRSLPPMEPLLRKPAGRRCPPARTASADCPAAHETGRVDYGRKPDRGIRETGRSVSGPVPKAGHRIRECWAVECLPCFRWCPFHRSRAPSLCRGVLCVPDEISKTNGSRSL